MAIAAIIQRRPLMAVIAMVALVLAGGVEAQITPRQAAGCTTSVISLSPCLSYVTGNGNGGFSKPSQGCCSGLATVLQTSSACLCQLLGTAGNPLGIPINRTAALSLPGACNISTPPLSQCNKGSSPARGQAATPSASSPSSLPGNIPSTASGEANIPSPSPAAVTGGATVFTPPTIMMIGAMSVITSIAW